MFWSEAEEMWGTQKSKNVRAQQPWRLITTRQEEDQTRRNKVHQTQHEEWPEKKENTLMAVASLIAFVAFQIGANPPGGVWHDDTAKDSKGKHVLACSSVFAHKYPDAYGIFHIVNTVAFIASLTIILFFISGFRLKWRIFPWILMFITWIAISVIALCYIRVVVVLTPSDKIDSILGVLGTTVIVWVGLMALLLISHTIRVIVKLVRKMRKTFKRRITTLVWTCHQIYPSYKSISLTMKNKQKPLYLMCLLYDVVWSLLYI